MTCYHRVPFFCLCIKPGKIDENISLTKKMALTVNEELERMMRPDYEVGVNLRRNLAGKWPRYWCSVDMEGTSNDLAGWLAMGATVLDLEKGQLLLDHEFFRSIKTPDKEDESTKQFWLKFPELRKFYEDVGVSRTDATLSAVEYFRGLGATLFKDDKWVLTADNVQYDFSKVDYPLMLEGFPVSRFLPTGNFGSVRDQHSLLLMFFANHPNGPDAYCALKAIALKVHQQLLEAEPSKYGTGNPDHDKWMVEHHPVLDARLNALMLLAMFRFMAKYPQDYVVRAAEFIL